MAVSAQPLAVPVPKFLEPQKIEISNGKTSTLIFHYKIRNVDTGSSAIIARLANDTALWIRAAISAFKETNLSVFTSDGRLHPFTVTFAKDPEHLYIQNQESCEGSASIPQENDITDAEYEHFSIQATTAATNVRRSGKHGGAKLKISGIYAIDGILYFRCELSNSTAISYNIKQLSFTIKDKHQIKRMAQQQITQQPTHTMGNLTKIPPYSKNTIVVAIPAFTIPDGKRLHVQMLEKDGGRNVTIIIKNRLLIRAKTL